MAHRQGGSQLPLLILAITIVSACTATGSTTTVTSAPPTTTTTSSTTTTTTTTTTMPPTTIPVGFDGVVRVPEGEGPYPAVVLVHGGSWISGSPASIQPLAEALTRSGYLTVNTRYRLATTRTPGFPGAVDDVACAVRYAATHPDSDGSVVLVGHSAGAHIGAIIALAGGEYGDGCPYDGDGVPDRFVGMGGPYNIHELGLIPLLFFGGGPNSLSDLWEAGNPFLLAGRYTAPPTLLIHAELDALVSSVFAEEFQDAIQDAGGIADLMVVVGAHHNDLQAPEITAPLIVGWLDQ